VPVITNVEASANSVADRVQGLLRSQVTLPVRFAEMVEELTSQGVDHFLEIGPGRVLSGLVARIQRRSKRENLASVEDLEGAREFARAGA
jgi:[acyl-carrier-protein] S-malonyltransferase